MGKEFNPEAIKEKLAEIKEQEEVETFTCSGCLTDTAGLMFQDKLCKSCALELIAYSRKAQNHIDSLRPIYKFDDSLEMKGDRKKFIGNSVVPLVAQKIIEAINSELNSENRRIA